MTGTSSAITPESTARANIQGSPVKLGDGNTWILANTVPVWGPLWDQLYDQNVQRGRYEPEHIMVGALTLLTYNYRLSSEEAGALILGGDLKGMKLAIERAMLSPNRPQWTYSDWVLSSLAANGLVLENIPDGILPAVLDQLVRMGRAVPEHLFVASAARASRRGKFMAVAKQQAEQREKAEAQKAESQEGDSQETESAEPQSPNE
jgi:hypothetical protein